MDYPKVLKLRDPHQPRDPRRKIIYIIIIIFFGKLIEENQRCFVARYLCTVPKRKCTY